MKGNNGVRPARGEMFIDRNITKDNSPFGGAEYFQMGTCLLEFRSSERRVMGVARKL